PGSPELRRTVCHLRGSWRHSTPPVAALNPDNVPRLLNGLGVLIGGDELVVGEHHGTAFQDRAIYALKTSYRIRPSVPGMGTFVLEGKQVHEPGRVVLLLPGGVHDGPGLGCGDVTDELLDGGDHGRNTVGTNLVVGGLIDGHNPFLS